MEINHPQQPTYPLTLSQLLVWEGEIVAASHFTHLSSLVKLDDSPDIEAWRESIRCVIRENEGLRLRMLPQGEDVRQYVAPEFPVEIPFLDFYHAGGEEEFRSWIEEERRKRFPVVDSPLFSFKILRLSSQDNRLFLKVHHLVSDAWTITVLIEQIKNHYQAIRSGEALKDKPPASYLEYLLQQNAPSALEKARFFFTYLFEKLTSAPPAARIRPDLPRPVSNQAARKTFSIPPTLRAEILRFNESNHSSVYLFFLSSILLDISLANAIGDTAIGTLFHNRLNPAYANTVGLFNVILPLRVKVSEDLSFRDLIKRVLSAWKQAIQRQPGRLSLQELTLLYQHADNLFDVLVSYENHLPEELPEWLHGNDDLEPISLMITILDYPSGGLDVEFLYRTEMYSQGDIETVYIQLVRLWEQLLAEPDEKIRELKKSRHV
jgi:hypothetical protein